MGGVACERQRGAIGPFRGRGYPGPCKEGWARRVSQRGWTSAPMAQAWLGAAPGEMDLCANQGTSWHSRGAASSCFLGWTQPPIPGISPGMDRATEKGSKQHLKGRQPEPRGSLSRSAVPGEGKEVASGISGQSPLLLNIARHRGRVSLGSGPWSAAQGLSVSPK